jgi:hypothetical protein
MIVVGSDNQRATVTSYSYKFARDTKKGLANDNQQRQTSSPSVVAGLILIDGVLQRRTERRKNDLEVAS